MSPTAKPAMVHRKADIASPSRMFPANGRMEYHRPAIIHTERIEARAMVCSKAPSHCHPGPAYS